LSVGNLPADTRSGNVPRMTAPLQVIVNPASGNGKARKRWPEMATALMNHGLEHQVTFTSGPNDATGIARRLALGGAKTIVAVGGDGTVNEIVNGLLKDGKPVNPDTRLLVLPSGTGKDLGRTLGTGQIEAAIDALVADTTVCMDVGSISYTDTDGAEVSRYFANVADLGLGATVAERISRSSKRLGGLLTYLVAAVKSIVTYTPGTITVEIGEDQIFNGAANMVVLANGQYFAGGMHVAPTATICDGLLEMYILADVGRRTLLTSLLPRVYRGRHVGRPGVFHVRTGAVTIRCDGNMLLEMDGEQVGRAPVTVDVVPQALPVIIHKSRRRNMAGCESG
jgi:diacylglycerol kinase (ATP)